MPMQINWVSPQQVCFLAYRPLSRDFQLLVYTSFLKFHVSNTQPNLHFQIALTTSTVISEEESYQL